MARGHVLVTGATGVLGSHVVRELVTHGWRVRAMTHRPERQRAQALAGPRVEVFGADVRDPKSLRAAVAGVDAVYLLEPWRVDGADGARTAGVAVANAAAGAGVSHVVFSSLSGAGSATEVAHLERKRAVELHLRALDVPTTVLRPVLLMERVLGYQGRSSFLPLLGQSLRVPSPPGQAQEAVSYEAAATTSTTSTGGTALLAPLMARVRQRHSHVPLQVVAAADVATIARLALEDPSRHLGLAIEIAGDELTVPEMVQSYRGVTGRQAPGWFGPLPRRDPHGPPADLVDLLAWLREEGFKADVAVLRTRYPWLSSFSRWLLGAVSV